MQGCCLPKHWRKEVSPRVARHDSEGRGSKPRLTCWKSHRKIRHHGSVLTPGQLLAFSRISKLQQGNAESSFRCGALRSHTRGEEAQRKTIRVQSPQVQDRSLQKAQAAHTAHNAGSCHREWGLKIPTWPILGVPFPKPVLEG